MWHWGEMSWLISGNARSPCINNHRRHEYGCHIESITWLLMPWRRTNLEQLPLYYSSSPNRPVSPPERLKLKVLFFFHFWYVRKVRFRAQEGMPLVLSVPVTLQWRHNERDDVSNHRCLVYLLNRLFRRRSKNTSNPESLAFVRGIHRWPVDSPHKGLVTRKIFPFDDSIIIFNEHIISLISRGN